MTIATDIFKGTIPLRSLLDLTSTDSPDAAFTIAPRQKQKRWIVTPATDSLDLVPLQGSLRAIPQEPTGDSPQKYHPKYVMAILTSARTSDSPNPDTSDSTHKALTKLLHWPIPIVKFTTEEYVRRSMALNGMRMSMEYFESDSPRIRQLISQRLEVGQRDVVHDVLVYLMQYIIDIRAKALEARLLRAESVAAYLGLNQRAVNLLFTTPQLAPVKITQQIEGGAVGNLRRSINVSQLIESQIEHLKPSLREYKRSEQHTLKLLDDITNDLYQTK